MSRKRGDNGDARTPGVARACHGIRVCKPPGSIKRSDRMCLLAGNKHGGRYRQLAGPLPTVRAPSPPPLYILYEMRVVMNICVRGLFVISATVMGVVYGMFGTLHIVITLVLLKLRTDELTRLPF